MIKGKRKDDVKSNNYFHYDDETVERLELIGYAKAVGFTLSEIAQLIDAWYNKQFKIADKIAILDEKLVSIEGKIKQLEDIKKLIAEFKADVMEHDC